MSTFSSFYSCRIMYFNTLFLRLSFLINCIAIISSDTNEACLINSNVAGQLILGFYSESLNGIPYCTYFGIPYAQPPVGELRFKPPQPINFTYDYVTSYTTPSYECISRKDMGITNVTQSEDCLYLNIFIPLSVLRAKEKNAVVVWVHGGSYNVGSGLSDMHPTRGPELFVENSMIFVSFNYRLGPLGFLRVPELNITGNYGLLDQRFVLKWVHANIHLWNGDKDNVTLMGWSAGSASATYHLLAAETNSYFKNVILMSGSLANPWANFYQPEICLKRLLRNLDIKPRHISRLLTINATEFSRVQSAYKLNFGLNNVCFIPTVDDIMVNNTINYKLTKNINIMIGWTNLEFQHFILEFVSTAPKVKPFRRIDLFNNTKRKVQRLRNYLKNEFYNNSRMYLDPSTANWLSNDTEVYYRLMSKLLSDDHMKFGIQRFVKSLQEANGNDLNIFMYQFSYAGNFSTNRKFNDSFEGAGHGDDLPYLYRTELNLNNSDAINRNEWFVQNAMIKTWTNFMKHGIPTPTPIASSPNYTKESLVWGNYHETQRQFLDINLQIKMIPEIDDAMHQLWVRLENCIRHDLCSFLDESEHCV